MSDLISRQAAIDALKNDMASLDNIIKGMSAYDVRLYAYVSQRNQVSYDIDTINNLPTAQPESCEDAVSRKDCLKALSNMMDTDGFRNGWAVSRANVECMLKAMPSVTPKQRTDLLKAEIKRMKRSFTTCINSDYYTGYMSALSAVEGYIAQWEGDAE